MQEARRRRKERKRTPLPSQDCLCVVFFFFLIFTRACASLVPSIRTRSWMFNKEIKCLNSHQKKKKKPTKKTKPKKKNFQKAKTKRERRKNKNKKSKTKQTNKQGRTNLYFKPAGTATRVLPATQRGGSPAPGGGVAGTGGQRPSDALGATGQEAEETRRGERDSGPPRAAARGWGARSGTGAN